MSGFARLVARFTRIATIEEAGAMLGWDAETMMPAGSGAARADQLAVLAGLAHELLSAPELADWLDEAEAAPPADEWDRADLALMRRAHLRATALPQALVEAIARANAGTELAWRAARAADDFAAIAPGLQENVALAREQAAGLGAALGLSPYDAAIDGFQPGLREEAIGPIFEGYLAFLQDFLPVAEAAAAPSRPAPPAAAERQHAFCQAIAERAGLDLTRARLDRSAHPFCGGCPGDVRITTRYDEADYGSALMGVIHETGHALYEQNLPARFARRPVGAACGMAVHESQSLLLEMQAARGDEFLGWLGGALHAAFGGEAAPYAPENLKARSRLVRRSLIRVEADEVTYPAHIAVRVRLEQALFRGDLAVAELPGAWREAMESVLGVRPQDDRSGCLQDIHWYAGLFGYFPSYTIGAMMAAQWMQAARQARPEIDAALGRGDFTPLRAWLAEAVHGQGSRWGFDALLERGTGERLNPLHFQRHLRRRYGGPAQRE